MGRSRIPPDLAAKIREKVKALPAITIYAGTEPLDDFLAVLDPSKTWRATTTSIVGKGKRVWQVEMSPALPPAPAGLCWLRAYEIDGPVTEFARPVLPGPGLSKMLWALLHLAGCVWPSGLENWTECDTPICPQES